MTRFGSKVSATSRVLLGLVAGFLLGLALAQSTLPLATGTQAFAGAVVAYVVLVVSLTVLVVVVLLYLIGILAGPLSAREFVALCAPAQAVAFASRSSLASLSAMAEAAERARLPAVVSRFVVPLAASVFRVGGAVALPVGVLFLARLYGVSLSLAQLGSVVVTVALTTFAVPGIPGGSIIATVPILAAANLPIDGVGILYAVDAITGMFRTTANVTGGLTLAAVVAGRASPP